MAHQANDPTPSHYCTVCGTAWRFWRKEEVEGAKTGTWNMRSGLGGDCCRDAKMGDQIKPMTVERMSAWLKA